MIVNDLGSHDRRDVRQRCGVTVTGGLVRVSGARVCGQRVRVLVVSVLHAFSPRTHVRSLVVRGLTVTTGLRESEVRVAGLVSDIHVGAVQVRRVRVTQECFAAVCALCGGLQQARQGIGGGDRAAQVRAELDSGALLRGLPLEENVLPTTVRNLVFFPVTTVTHPAGHVGCVIEHGLQVVPVIITGRGLVDFR